MQFPLSPVPCPLSPSPRRPGVTIMEVLFSILITSVGLLGAIALFPVASTQAKRAQLNDQAASSAHSAIHMFDTMGMRRPDRWIGWPVPWNSTAATNFALVQAMPNVPRGTSFCIDPRTVAANIGANAAQASRFPSAIPLANPASPRMFRISLLSGSSVPANMVMGQFQADSVFVFGDDLAFLRPGLDDVSNLPVNPNLPLTKYQNDRSLPAFQVFPTTGTAPNLAPVYRPTHGRLSWMATLVPKVEVYSGQVSDEYVLSIVIIADRSSDLLVTDPLHERVVTAIVEGDGSTGGEVQLNWASSVQDDDAAKQQLKVRANEWILISANQVFGTRVVPRFQWYRVSDVDEIEPWSGSAYIRYVTLMGQDWNTSYVNPRTPAIVGAAEATLIEGVVAVFEKTIRLDLGSTF